LQEVYQIEFFTLVDASFTIKYSVNNNNHTGEYFNPAGIVQAAKDLDSAVFTTSTLSYADLLRERPPLHRDRESSLDMAMAGACLRMRPALAAAAAVCFCF
jgi:hypothetical protein